MKKLILISIIALVFASCGTKEMPKIVITASVAPVEAPKAMIKFSDPTRIAGSSFGNFFIAMMKTQNYDMALKFTSKTSIEKFGIDKIKEKYENFKFNYKLFPKSTVREGNTFTIVYTTKEYATAKLKKLTVVLENDTCKLLLPENINDLLR